MRHGVFQNVNMGLLALGAAALALSACSESEDRRTTDSASYEAADESVEAAADMADAESASSSTSSTISPEAIPTNLPKLAYAYGFNYSLPSQDMSGLMRRHANICEQQGPTSCQIIGMNLSGEIEDDNRRGILQLAVASQHARAVGALLEDEALDAGAEQVSANISTDELSKQMVDTQARIETRTALRDRLLDVLKTRKGTVEELVAAERSVAQVNEEIDQARSWLSEMKGRVQFSKVDIEYRSAEALSGDFLDPVKGALGSLGSIFGVMLAALILMLAVALPIGGVIFGLRGIARRFGTKDGLASES